MSLFKWFKSGNTSVRSSRQSSMLRSSSRSALLLEGLAPLPSEIMEPPESEEQRYIQRRIRDNPMWTLDRGTGFYQQERLSKKKASLLGSGRNAGKSMVLYRGIEWTRILRHIWKRDFFTTAVHARFQYIVLAMVVVFISSFLFWACIYYGIWRIEPKCFLGFHSFLSAFLFSIETQNTIGYGSHAIGDCWLPAWLVGLQCILAVLLEAIFLGIIFAKISHPKGRSRTIIISECACIARRDGILKFMFRVADIRKRTAIGPRIQAHLYTWGPGHTTAEGERIPVQVQPLPLHYLDPTLLLPVVVEHTVDERSPLYGHTSQSLEALSAEIVVTFEGSSELGDAFMTRRSYLPSEIHWGCMFVNIVQHAELGNMQHRVDLSRFHEVEPQEGLALMPPHRISRAVVLGGSRRIPRARLGENTLQLADELVVTQAPDGTWFVAVRVGDAYPSQMCSAKVQMFIYRYNTTQGPTPPGSMVGVHDTSASAAATAAGTAVHNSNQTYVHQELPLTRHLWRPDPATEQETPSSASTPQHSQQQQPADPAAAARMSTAVKAAAAASAASHAGGGVNVLLRYPVVVGHEIGPDSPLREWISHDGMLKDADAEIVVVTSATMYITSNLSMRSKVYSVLGSIRWGYSYSACVVPPSKSPTGHALVDWSKFHDVMPFHSEARPKGSNRRGTGGYITPQGYHTPQDSHSRQQQQQSRPGLSAAWFDSVNAAADGSSCTSWQQHEQQHWVAGQDVYESQVEQLLSSSLGEHSLDSSSCNSWQQMVRQAASRPHPQQQQGRDIAVVRSSSSRLSSVVVHGSTNGEVQDSSSLPVAHSLGFSHFHDLGELQAKLQQQRQQQQGAAGLRSSETEAGLKQVRQGISSAAELHSATAAAALQRAYSQPAAASSSRAAAAAGVTSHQGAEPGQFEAAVEAAGLVGQYDSGVGPSCAAAVRHALGGSGFGQEYEDDHTLTIVPHTSDSSAGRCSLAAVMELFEAGEQQLLADEAAAAAAGRKVAQSSTPEARQQHDKQQQNRPQ